VGLTGHQYQALLVVRSLAGSAPVSIADLADQLLLKHNSAVGLADRLVAQSLIVRERIAESHPKVQLQLTAKGERVMGKLAGLHLRKLQRIGPEMAPILEGLTHVWHERD
jgi:DNA-binding MarR family transcriptional regulator